MGSNLERISLSMYCFVKVCRNSKADKRGNELGKEIKNLFDEGNGI